MIEEKQAVKKSKNTLRKYRDSKLSTSLQILNYLFTELPETTRKRLEIIYNLEKSNDNIEAVFVSNKKKSYLRMIHTCARLLSKKTLVLEMRDIRKRCHRIYLMKSWAVSSCSKCQGTVAIIKSMKGYPH